jgi:hypothetical protein
MKIRTFFRHPLGTSTFNSKSVCRIMKIRTFFMHPLGTSTFDSKSVCRIMKIRTFSCTHWVQVRSILKVCAELWKFVPFSCTHWVQVRSIPKVCAELWRFVPFHAPIGYKYVRFQKCVQIVSPWYSEQGHCRPVVPIDTFMQQASSRMKTASQDLSPSTTCFRQQIYDENRYYGKIPGSSVSIVTRLRGGRTEFDSRQRQGIFLLAIAFRLALGPRQPPIQWVSGALSPGVRSCPLTSNYCRR